MPFRLFVGLLFYSLPFGMGSPATAQTRDTVRIDASKIRTGALIRGVHRYLVYFKNGKDSSRIKYQMWTREIDLVTYEGREAISIKQEWESNTKVFHTVTSFCDRKTFAPLYQESWWESRGSGMFDFVRNRATVNGKALGEATDSAGMSQWSAFEKARAEYVLNWHLDLEVFSTLPLRDHTTFLVNYYDPGFSPPQFVPYTVTGSGILAGYDRQKIDCWLLQTKDETNNETFWISKKTHEVLKMEQQNGTTLRYKIKLPFSV
jgi:hypothetical protein